ncbi:MAG: TonB-dependent receptor [Pyrinomonadaceae bacterium]|nr:TonB-dependent receptor [Pyrinomonadaceae bacterium]MCX7639730.1 TonB-dependent receptor [Pyrinomonadaceae bacterium]MDW8304313.1 TonB-dependent receptor [Acidobacteriota bacterium]
MKRKIGLMIFVFALSVSVFAQKVTIRLVEKGKPVANEKVRLVSATAVFEFQTDAEGNIEAQLSDGSYLVSYGDKTGILTIRNGQVASFEINEVVVVSTNTLQSIGEVSKTVSIIDGSQIRDRQEFSLADLLRTVPGFRIQQLGGFGRLASVKTRGLRNQDTAVLIDGVRFRDAASINGDATAFLADFTLTDISRVEIMRGSGSSVYGTNAIGGTIDLQTSRPESGINGRLGLMLGGYGLSRFDSVFGDGNEKFAYRLGASRTVYTSGIDGQDNAHNTNFQSRLEFNPTKLTNFSAKFFISDAFVRLNSSPDTIGPLPPTNAVVIKAVPLSRSELRRYENGTPVSQLNRGNANFIPDANDPDSTQKSKFFNAQVSFTQVVTDRLLLKAFYNGLKTSRKNENGVLGIGFQSASTSIFDGLIQTAQVRLDWTPNRFHEITFGYEFEHEKYGNDGFTPTGTGNFFTRAYQSSNTLFAQDLIRLLEGKLTVALGARFQTFNLEEPKFSRTNAPYQNLSLSDPPNAYTFDGSASYFISATKTKLRAHAGTGFRVPSLYERFGSFFSSFSQSFTALGDPYLKPERSFTFDVGLEQYLFDSRAKLSAVYFYTTLKEVIGFGSPVPNIGSTQRPFGGYFNTKGGISRGAEFTADVKITELTTLLMSYAYTNSDQRQPQVAGSGIIRTLAVPEHQFTLVATQKLKNFLVNFDFLATSNYLAPIFSNSVFRNYIYEFNGNRKADLTVGYSFPSVNERIRLRLFGTVENLFNQEYYENGFRTFGRYGRIGISFGF